MSFFLTLFAQYTFLNLLLLTNKWYIVPEFIFLKIIKISYKHMFFKKHIT